MPKTKTTRQPKASRGTPPANTDSQVVAAAILAAGFAAAQRQQLHSGKVEDTIREKFVEFYTFVREHSGRD